MSIGEGVAAGTLLLTLAGIIFNLGKAWHRLRGHGDALRTMKKECHDYTAACALKQDTRYQELRDRLDAVKTDTQAVREIVIAVKADVAWIRQKNGGTPNG